MPSTDSKSAEVRVRRATIDMPSLTAFVRHLEDQPESSNRLIRASDLLVDAFDRDESSHPYFLTVILRTQGRRPEPLKDALLCLSAQSLEDFHVVLVCHNAEEDDAAVVQSIVESQPRSFRERISVLRVDGGRRARPLNVALDAAQGRYVSFFDDDDLLLGHWVEEFAAAARKRPGKLIRSIVASQRVGHELWPQDQDGLRHLSWPTAEYPRHFDQIAHLHMNYSPFMGWAFPRQLFTVLGLRFDEELYVCEDWDMILRGSLSLGVVEAEALTAIYRRWEGVEASHTAHNTTQWQASELRVSAKLDEHVLLLPPGSAADLRTQLRERHELIHARDQLHAVLSSTGYRLSAPVRFAMRVADFGLRGSRSVARRARDLRRSLRP